MPSARRDTFRTNLYCRHLRPDAGECDSRSTGGPNVNTACPHPDCGCVSGRCLRSHVPADQLEAYDRALGIQPVTLRVLTGITPDPEAIPCNGSMTCPCEHCAKERARLVGRPKGSGNANPFRRAAA